MKSIFVRDVYTPAFEMVPETANFNEVVNKVISKKDPYFAVQNDAADLVGMISIHDIKSFLFDMQELQDIIIARDIAVKDFDKVTLEDNCQVVLDTLSHSGLSGLPVVDANKSNKILGMIWRRDILKTYNQEVEKKDIALTFVDKLVRQNTNNDVHFMGGYSVSEISVPESFINQSIKDLNIRAKFSVNVLSIRQKTAQGTQINAFPAPDYIIQEGDHLIIAGEIKMINLIKGLS